MEKKATIISLIFIGVIIAGAVSYIILSGNIAHDYNYVQIEVNPRVEFLCDKKYKVVSVSPLNNDARIVLSDLELIGLDVDEATTTFIDECAKCGYIDVNGIDNATNITIIDGLTQALDVHVTQSVYNYFRDNEIMSSVTETYEDRTMFDEKKKNDVYCANKYKLIKTITEVDKSRTIDELKKLSEVELIDIVESLHNSTPYSATNDEKITKQKLVEENSQRYTTHKNNITETSQQEFSTLFDKFQKLSINKYMEDFNREYIIWQEKHI